MLPLWQRGAAFLSGGGVNERPAQLAGLRKKGAHLVRLQPLAQRNVTAQLFARAPTRLAHVRARLAGVVVAKLGDGARDARGYLLGGCRPRARRHPTHLDAHLRWQRAAPSPGLTSQ